MNLEKGVRDLRRELATSQWAASQKEKSLNETNNSLRAQGERSSSSTPSPASHLLTCSHWLEEKIANLEKGVRDLRHELVTSQRAASRKEESLNKTIDSLVAQDERSSASNSILTSVIMLTSIRQRNHTTTTKSERPRTDHSCPRTEASV